MADSSVMGVTACLLHYDPASYSSRARLSGSATEPERKRVRKGDF
jgi:hypothetical protein